MNKEIRLNDSNREKRNSERRPKLIEQMRQQLRTMHYIYRTERNSSSFKLTSDTSNSAV